MNCRNRCAALTLIAITAAIRVLYLTSNCPLDLAPDEAHYWDWSQHLDWSYYSKGPLVAWLIRGSCELFGNTMLAVRLPAVLCGNLLLAGLYSLTVQVHRSDKLAFQVIVLALTLPIIAAGSSLMTIDAPFMCAWMWALVFGFHAVFRQANWAWPVAGVCLMLGVLAKHTMLLWVPCFGLFLLTTPSLRSHLRGVGFWMMTSIGALGGVPILLWNAQHDWVTLKHTRVHAGLDHDGGLRWLGPLAYLGAQFAVLLGFWFVAWFRAMWQHRPTRETRPELRFLWWMSAPVFVFFWLFALKNGGGEANWPLAAYLAGMVLVAGWMVQQWQGAIVWQRRIIQGGAASAAALGLVLTVAVHDMTPLQPVLLRIAGPASEQQPMPLRRVDPTSRLRGWRHLAAAVDRLRYELEASGVHPVLATERWTQASELRFYCAGHPAVYCLGVKMGDRDSQHDLWRPNPIADPALFSGQTFLMVGVELDALRPAFGAFEPRPAIEYREDGQLIASWKIVVARDFHGWGSMK
jgi:4-amino-4-deoxy-L-arabinose transferase-like glycosyltransferase